MRCPTRLCWLFWPTRIPSRCGPTTAARVAGGISVRNEANISLKTARIYSSSRILVTHCLSYCCSAPQGSTASQTTLRRGPSATCTHYGSSLNGKPLLRAYEISPDDYYILEPAIGAMSGVLSNIQPNGAASMGFHGDNALLKHDPFDADYGCALYGHVTSATSYFVQHPTFGPSCYLCNYRQSAAGEWTIVPVDSLHRRVYLEPLGTAIAVDVGRITSVLLSMANRTVVVALADEVGEFSAWRVSVVHYALCGVRPGCDLRVVSPAVTEVRGAWSFPVSSNSPTVTLTWGGSESDSSSERREEKLEVRTAERTAVA